MKSLAFLVLIALTTPLLPAQTGDATIRQVVPSAADPTLKTEYDAPNLVWIPHAVAHPELVVFLPGTHGRPNRNSPVLTMLASAGYRVINLEYNDVPNQDEACQAQDTPACGASFHDERIDGKAADAPVQNTVEESISHRLVSVLKYEAAAYPKEGWEAYLNNNGPDWSKIIITGHSQGAGHAAYIAKRHQVARAVLFSGGPSGTGPKNAPLKPSTWVTEPSRTPPDRWWAEFHSKEPISKQEPAGYLDLGIPKDHILTFTLDPEAGPGGKAPGYHVSVIQGTQYLSQWKMMFGIDAK